MLLKDKIALVTGAGDGIGRAVAEGFAKEGAFVVLVGRTQKKLETVFDAIEAAGGQSTIVPLDLENDLPKVPSVAGGIMQRFGHLDILVNSAGELGALTPLEFYEPEMWETVFRVNSTAPFFLIREMVPLLKKSPAASVINVSSSVARAGRAFWGAYAASKSAMVNWTETWAQELAKTNVRLNNLNPGGTRTAMRAQAFPGEDPETLPAPEEIFPAFLYLATEHSKGVTGEHLNARDWMDWKPPKAE